MSYWASKLDFISQKPHLYINGKDRLKVTIGGLLMILNILATLIISFYFVFILLVRQENNINFSVVPLIGQELNEANGLNFTDKPFMITLTDTLFSILDSERLYNIVGQITEFIPDGTNRSKRIFLEMEKCNSSKHFGEYLNYFENIPEIQKYFCLKPGFPSIHLKGIYGSLSRSFAFQINKCVNSTNVTCLDQSQINKKLENINIKFHYLDYQIQHNSSTPSSLYLKSEAITASSTVFKRIFYLMKNVVYSTDIGYIFQDLREDNFYQYQTPKEIIDLRSSGILPGNFVNVFFIMDAKIDKYNRGYMKFQTFIANAGGIIKFFSFITMMIVELFNKKLYFIEILKVYENNNNYDVQNKLVISESSNIRNINSESKILINRRHQKFKLNLLQRIFSFNSHKESTNNIYNKIEKVIRTELSVNMMIEKLIKLDLFQAILIGESLTNKIKSYGFNKDWICDNYVEGRILYANKIINLSLEKNLRDCVNKINDIIKD